MINSRLRTRRLRRALVLASSVLAGPAWAQGLPSGGEVISGSATISRNGNALIIDQASDRLIANWQSFSIDTGQSVTFNQPTVGSVALNRVIGQDPSRILGALNANGKVFLVNPHGIVIGQQGQVQTGGFVATTLGLKDGDFLAGEYRFTGTGGSIVNQGSLKGAVVALIAPSVTNQGTIRGDTAIAAGSDVLLDFDGNGLLSVEVKASTLATLVDNQGLIAANGGMAVLTARGASDVMRSVVNSSGTIEAQTLASRNGRIYLLGDMANGTVEVSGRLDASAPAGGDGGFVETSAAKVRIAEGATITTMAPLGKTGTLLIDPHDYRVAGLGDDEDITGTALTSLLLSNNVTIKSAAGAANGAGDITLADDVNLAANRLTLTAARDILIEAELNVLGTGTLAMNTATANGGEAGVAGGTVKVKIASDLSGFTGKVRFDRAGTGLLTINGDAYTVIDSIAALQAIATDANARYVLGTDIDAGASAGWNGGAGWVPIANYSGVFDGLGHSVDGMVIARTSFEMGLFGQILGTVRNLDVSNADVRGTTGNGVLAGYIGGTAHNILVSGQVRGSNQIGGLAGYAINQVQTASPMLYDVHAAVTVTGTADRVGGLIGWINQASLQNVSASGNVTGQYHVGGLIGWADTGGLIPVIQDASALGNVSGQRYVGGLLGNLDGYRLINTSAAGAVTNLAYSGPETVISGFGGLAGRARNTQVSDAVASGSVTITGNRDIDAVGGLIGYADNLSVSASSSTAAVSVITPGGLSASRVGGLIGFAGTGNATNANTLTDVQAFGDVDVSSGADAGYVGGLVGQAEAMAFSRASAAGHVAVASAGDTEYLGGLIGEITGGSVSDAQARGAVSGSSVSGGTGRTHYFGGLVGGATNASLTDVSASGDVTLSKDSPTLPDAGDAGGLLGTGVTVQILRASASGDVSANASRLGGLIGSLYSDSVDVLVSNVSASGSVTATATRLDDSQYVGGLIGLVTGTGISSTLRATIDQASATGATVSGHRYVGGLVGKFGGVAISDSSATANVIASRLDGGGLVGALDAGSLSDVRASGNVSGGSVGNLGGLIGSSFVGSQIERAFATGDVTGTGSQIGGLVGQNQAELYDVFATGNVAGSASVGGLAGYTEGSIHRAYANGSVSGTDASTTGGLVGDNLAVQIVAAFYDSQTTGQTDAGKGTGLTSAQLADPFTFLDAGWDFASIWGTPKAGGAPLLRGPASPPLHDYYVRIAGSLSRGYGDANPALSGLTLSGVGTANLGIAWGSGADATANAGTYGWLTPGLLSFSYAPATGATDYYVAYGSGGLTISPRVLSLTGARSYDRTTSVDASRFTLGNLANGETLVLTGAGQLADKSAGLARNVAIGTLALGNGTGLASNYTLMGGTRVVDIAQALITLSNVTAANKVYDGGLTATLDTSAASTAGLFAGDSVGVGSATGAFLDKNVGAGKTVVITGAVLTGADAANYRLTPQSGATADITPATISAITGIGGGTKVYDTRTDTNLDLSGAVFVGMVSGDALAVASATGAFADKHAGANKTVAVTGLSLGGADAGNYVLADTNATAVGEIRQAPLTSVAIGVATRAYDGTTAASLDLSSATFDQMLAGDELRLASASAVFADANAGIGKTVNVTGMTLGGADAGNYFLVSPDISAVGTITRAALTLSGFAAANKVYDGGVAATIANPGTLSGVIGGDSVGVIYDAARFTDKNAGIGKTVTLDGIALTGAGADNYTIAGTATASANIDRKTISAVNGLVADTRSYDGTTDATLDLGSATLVGALSGDLVGPISYAAHFADKNAGAGKMVIVSGLGLGGTDADNYALASQTATATGEITRAVLSLSGVAVADKVYDGTTAALVSNWGTLAGIVGTDDVTVAGGTVAFADKNAGSNKTVSFAALTLAGGDAGNYTLAPTAATSASIARATISAVTGIAGIAKTYDGATAAGFDASHAAFTGMIAGDILSVGSGSAFFTDKNAGMGKTVYVFGLTLAGADADNYWLTATNAVTSADIARATITGVGGIIAAGKTYDGTTGVMLDTSGASFAGRIGSDALTVASAAGSFADKNVGLGKTVDIAGITLGGADAGNYALGATNATTSADIARATISAVTGIIAAGKTYDGTTAAALDTSGASFAGRIGSDTLTVVHATGSFADRNAGIGKAVDISGIALGGADAGNYVLASTEATASADIARATIRAVTGIIAANKTYDGTTTATLDATGATFAGKIDGDALGVARATGSFATKDAGTGKAVTITGLELGGADAGNYALAPINVTATAEITRATISGITGIAAASKTYDGSTAATLDLSGAILAGAVAGDVLTLSGSGRFADKNAGTNKPVTLTGLALGGADAGNYDLAPVSATTQADIARATITEVAGIAARNKTYDGTTHAELDGAGATFAGMIAGDALTVSGSAAFADKNAGTGKMVDVTALRLGGADAGNYTLAATSTTSRADIFRASITGVSGITARDKIYDGNRSAQVDTTGAMLAGMIAGDRLTISGTGSFADKNAGASKPVTVTALALGGADAGNYVLAASGATALATIGRAPIQVSGVRAGNKVYDGTTDASLELSGIVLTGLIVGDSLTLVNATGRFADKNAGRGKTVSVGGITLGGSDEGNYVVDGAINATADIDRAVIGTITGIIGIDKPYDGTANATIDPSHALFDGMIAGDHLDVAAALASFADALPGRDKPIAISGLVLGGADAGNYRLASDTATASADIIREVSAPMFPDQLGKSRVDGFGGPSDSLLSAPELVENSSHPAEESKMGE